MLWRLAQAISVAEAALRAVPNSYYEGALALGAGHVRSVFFTIVPAAKSGIMAAIILGLGRAVGETMAVIMVAGNQARMPQGLLEGVRTMTTNIVIEMGYAADMHRDALIATAVVLFVFILIINLTFSYLKGKVVQRARPRVHRFTCLRIRFGSRYFYVAGLFVGLYFNAGHPQHQP